MEKKFYFEGWQEYYTKLLPRDTTTIIAHNDCQENNILISLKDNLNLMMVDFEYTGWQPRAMDIANYFNETMLDNAYNYKNGITYYTENIMDKEELADFEQTYLKAAGIDVAIEQFHKEVVQCAIFNNFFWGVWPIMMIPE